MTTTAAGLTFLNACYCAGTGCGGHVLHVPVTITEACSIPFGCICAYTWGWFNGKMVPVRNGALQTCPASHG